MSTAPLQIMNGKPMDSSSKKKPGRPKNKELARRRHQQILEAAAKMFAQYGYPNTDVQTIADLLEIGKGTIYRYFSTKRELFLAAVDRGMKSLSEKVDHQISTIKDPIEKFTKAIYSHLSFFDEYPEYVELIIQERAGFKERSHLNCMAYISSHVKNWQELCHNLVNHKTVRNISSEKVLDVVNDMVYGTIFTNYFTSRTKSFEAQAKDILDIVLHGILDSSKDVSTRT